jgi:hypothetical protein
LSSDPIRIRIHNRSIEDKFISKLEKSKLNVKYLLKYFLPTIIKTKKNKQKKQKILKSFFAPGFKFLIQIHKIVESGSTTLVVSLAKVR